MKKYIGVFDSGLGGLTVVKAMKESLNENIVYLADSKNMPYGNKTNDQIISFSINNVNTLSAYNLKAIVIACNTSDSIARKTLEEKYDMPIFGVIKPAAKKAYALSKNKKIGVLATVAAINSNQYELNLKQLDNDVTVYSKACPLLVPMIEDGKFNDNNTEMLETLKEYLKDMIDNDVDTVILGCTHYDLLTNIIKKIMPDVNIVSSSRCVIDDIKESLDKNDNTGKTEQIYLATSDPNKLESVAKKIISDIEIKKV